MRKLKNSELERLDQEAFVKATKIPLIIVLDNIRSLNNIGSVFRSSDAFLIEKICLCGITACPPHRDIHKTALGATETVEWSYYENTLDALQELKDKNYQIAAIEQVENSISLSDFKPEKNQKYAIVMGNEVKGVSQKVINISDVCIEIPQYGTKHSLNISVCTGIVIWDFFNKISLQNN